MAHSRDFDSDHVIVLTRRWLERAVIGLGLCPFAKPVYRQNLIRFTVSAARSESALLDDLGRELVSLDTSSPAEHETTLLIHPWLLEDFMSYNAFLGQADRRLIEMDLEGEIQIASFHPQYRFADAREDDPANNSNRSPFPMLHLLREASVERAIESWPDTDSIYLRNIEILRALDHAGWRRLFEDDPGTP